MTSPCVPTILLVEDNYGDVELFKEALSSRAERIGLHHIASVDEGILWLEKHVCVQEPVSLCVIILDLHMPGKNGKDLLRFLHARPDLHHIPTVVLSSSLWQKDIDECADLGALHYRAKPFDWQGFDDLMNFLKKFWTTPDDAEKNRKPA